MWSDLSLIGDFILSTFSGIFNLVMGSVLVCSVGLWLLSLIVKVFKRII